MTTDGVAINPDQQILKMGPSIHNDTMEKFNDIAPMIILEPANQFYDNEQIIISDNLAISDLSNSKFENGNMYINSNSYDETHFSITVIDNDKVDIGLMNCYETIENSSFDALNSMIDYSELSEVPVLNPYPEQDTVTSNELFESNQRHETVQNIAEEIKEEKSILVEETKVVVDNSKQTPKEGQGSLECILKNLLIESKNQESSQNVPLLNGCKRPALFSNSTQKKIKLNEDINGISEPKIESIKENDGKMKKINISQPENIQILKIETKPPKSNCIDKDLTSLNWLHKLNIVKVPQLPTPPSSPTFQKNCKKPNSFSLRLQYGKQKI